jgi:glucosamine 6-phosphate synthetase-like amidotransferase/phosphosugar isomerase protein
VSVPDEATQLLVHVRDYTKGHPTIEANNHPVRHGSVVGIHNGIITNDDDIFARHRFARSHPDMTVDSAAIFALAERADSLAEAFDELCGSMAAAWMDERRADVLFLARGAGRPLWIGRGENELLFASTEATLKLA